MDAIIIPNSISIKNIPKCFLYIHLKFFAARFSSQNALDLFTTAFHLLTFFPNCQVKAFNAKTFPNFPIHTPSL